MGARAMTETTPFEHTVIPRHTEFRRAPEFTDVRIQDIYAALVDYAARNEMSGYVIEQETTPPCPTAAASP